MTMATLLLATRKGVFVVERSPVSGWTVIGRTSFRPPGVDPIEELVMRFNISAGAR